MKPVLQALVLADRVYEDKPTGKKIIAGTFNRVLVSKSSLIREKKQEDGSTKKTMVGGMRSGSPYAYVSFTEVHGKRSLTLRYVDLGENTVLFEGMALVESPDPLRTIELIIALPELPMPHPGVFAFEILYENELLGSHRINVDEFEIEQE